MKGKRLLTVALVISLLFGRTAYGQEYISDTDTAIVNETEESSNETIAMDECEVILERTAYCYDGTEKKPKVTVVHNDVELTEGEDYLVAYANNIDVGEGTVTVAGNGTTYIGEQVLIFHIYEVTEDLALGENHIFIDTDKSLVKTVSFIPDETASYRFYIGDAYNRGISFALNDSEGNNLENTLFGEIIQTLTVGETYYLRVEYVSGGGFKHDGIETILVEKAVITSALTEGNNIVSVNAGEITIVSFKPDQDAKYRIYSTGNSDTYGYLYDSEMNEITFDDDGGEDTNFRLREELKADQTYYIGVQYLNSSESGEITVVVEQVQKVYIKDSALENTLIDQCDVDGDGYVADDELATVTMLRMSSKGIVDISGLEQAKKLSFLELDGNEISDISPLAGLTSLTHINLNNTSVGDISVLKDMAQLNYLELDNTAVEDISVLTNMVSLADLGLKNTKVKNIDALSVATDLQTLDLSGTAVENISALANKKSLVWLYLRDTNVSDIEALSDSTELRILDLGSTAIEDISVIENMKSLEWLWLENTNVKDIEFIGDLDKLDLFYFTKDNIPAEQILNLYLKNFQTIVIDLGGEQDISASISGTLSTIELNVCIYRLV